MKIEVKGINDFTPGLIQSMIKKSYAAFFDYFPAEKEWLYAHWEQEDLAAFENKHIGNCVAFTCIDGQPVGYFSWDPRKFPVGIVGQNCILPEFRGNGYGSKQIEWIINHFRAENFMEIQVTTGDHEFFVRAQKMYKKCGFLEYQKRKDELFELIDMRTNIDSKNKTL